jgi:hypothetical protein
MRERIDRRTEAAKDCFDDLAEFCRGFGSFAVVARMGCGSMRKITFGPQMMAAIWC